VFDRNGNRKYVNRIEREAFGQLAKKVQNLNRRAFCLTVFYTGCRISEALHLKLSKIDFRDRSIVFETLKRRKKGIFRAVPAPSQLIELIGRISKGKRPDARIWRFSRTTAYREIKRVMVGAQIGGAMACPKGLRHGFGVACVSRDVPLPTVKKWLGHARMETTAIYLDVSGDEEREFAARTWGNRRRF
jgi:integrase/recombinase XerD